MNQTYNLLSMNVELLHEKYMETTWSMILIWWFVKIQMSQLHGIRLDGILGRGPSIESQTWTVQARPLNLGTGMWSCIYRMKVIGFMTCRINAQSPSGLQWIQWIRAPWDELILLVPGASDNVDRGQFVSSYGALKWMKKMDACVLSRKVINLNFTSISR